MSGVAGLSNRKILEKATFTMKRIFCFAFAGAILAMPVIGPAGLLGVVLAFCCLFRNADWLPPPSRVNADAGWLRRTGKRPKCRRANAKH
jgi:hypothetical protein